MVGEAEIWLRGTLEELQAQKKAMASRDKMAAAMERMRKAGRERNTEEMAAAMADMREAARERNSKMDDKEKERRYAILTEQTRRSCELMSMAERYIILFGGDIAIVGPYFSCGSAYHIADRMRAAAGSIEDAEAPSPSSSSCTSPLEQPPPAA